MKRRPSGFSISKAAFGFEQYKAAGGEKRWRLTWCLFRFSHWGGRVEQP